MRPIEYCIPCSSSTWREACAAYGSLTPEQKEILIEAYRGGARKVPELMKQIPSADDFYMDSISRVTINRYFKGRVVLLGDTSYGNTLGGFGTGLAIVGAYVLAGELHRSNGDHEVAYAQYESKFRGYAKVS